MPNEESIANKERIKEIVAGIEDGIQKAVEDLAEKYSDDVGKVLPGSVCAGNGAVILREGGHSPVCENRQGPAWTVP